MITKKTIEEEMIEMTVEEIMIKMTVEETMIEKKEMIVMTIVETI